MCMERTLISETPQHIGTMVLLKGWLVSIRDHGGVSFFTMRDATGIVQVVVTKALRAQYPLLSEWSTVALTGQITERPEKLRNPAMPTGSIEVQAQAIEVLSVAQPLPLPIDSEGYEITEDLRLRYRYLDLRRERIQRNLKTRQQMQDIVRESLRAQRFYEIETPLLTKSTPEGARDFVVPSRLQPGTFYALPQSPQQYKQLLMVAGFERYFQFARCLRDEDLRADRVLEFTQLDLEMSFTTREEVMALNEALLIHLVKTLFPQKHIQELPFPCIDYADAMKLYKTDRPDIRKDKNDPNLLAFCWVVNFPFFEKTDEGGWTFTHNPFSEPLPEHKKDLLAKKNIEHILTTQYDIVLNGSEIGGGSIRAHEPHTLHTVFEIMGFKKDRIQEQFGHMLEAFTYGPPPHGGIAWGFDRLVAMLMNEPSIREVIALPTGGSGKTAIMDAPSPIDPQQLKELKLSIVHEKKRSSKKKPTKRS